MRKRVVAGTACFAVALLCACSSDSDDPSTAQQPPTGRQPPTDTPPSGNRAPTITGSPQGTVLVGQQYNFAPTANDADSDALTFTIANKPGWANFNAATGVLSGTPLAGDVRSYSDIRISVSDGTATTNLAAFSIQVTAVAAGSALLSWTAPSLNTDGSALTNLSGYRIYWGTSQGSYSNSVSVSLGTVSYVVEQLTPGTWHFSVTAINSQGVESVYSNAATKTI